MRDDERLFSFGFGFFLFALIAVAIFHVAFSSDEKELNLQNEKIISMRRELDNALSRLSELVRPETLRPIAMRIYPSFRPIGTDRMIGAGDME